MPWHWHYGSERTGFFQILSNFILPFVKVKFCFILLLKDDIYVNIFYQL